MSEGEKEGRAERKLIPPLSHTRFLFRERNCVSGAKDGCHFHPPPFCMGEVSSSKKEHGRDWILAILQSNISSPSRTVNNVCLCKSKYRMGENNSRGENTEHLTPA